MKKRLMAAILVVLCSGSATAKVTYDDAIKAIISLMLLILIHHEHMALLPLSYLFKLAEVEARLFSLVYRQPIIRQAIEHLSVQLHTIAH